MPKFSVVFDFQFFNYILQKPAVILNYWTDSLNSLFFGKKSNAYICITNNYGFLNNY